MANYINQYKEFLVPEKRVPKNQIKQCNIYRHQLIQVILKEVVNQDTFLLLVE